MAIPKFDPDSLTRHYDSRVVPAWKATQESVNQKEQEHEAGKRRANVADEELRDKYQMDRGGH